MPIYNLEDVAVFCHKSENYVICYDCFEKGNEDFKNYEIVTQEEIESEEKIYVCDKCGEKIN